MGKSKKLYLVDKTTGKIVQDDNGNDIVKTTEWEPEATQGSIDVEIPVTGKKLAGRTLVVFEEIYLGDAMIACHKDINDANQTIKVKGYRDCTVIKRIKADDYWKSMVIQPLSSNLQERIHWELHILIIRVSHLLKAM